ncbi:GreA/GreB family elongation factor [Parvibaculum sp.]|uniref:GreA/GreB family elongation factor n=1 Tax=Parvibaculum sp. TaxID=2024848 RepID=UPI00271F4B2E|nr:GreA/GreB family elongation factor [Parvibaculum sp.]MDO9127613.1 GreA/GreB family elongation factor [Parvibaculum sp.]MDP1628087.1 GreA/GreB family elongation factor [Parvibaculum sp.]MDP2151086.1 GreA/GreB family elongation factor [Parvibaculum sp.]MDP3328553.1 GreA/GreB family elongation factor [Parvibaculum sp.]
MSIRNGGASRPQLVLAATPPPEQRPLLTSHDYARLELVCFEQLDLLNPMTPFVRAKLAEARVIPGTEIPGTVATLGSIVRYRIEDRMLERRILQLDARHTPNGHYLSALTPIGLALLGRSAGDICEAELFNGAKLKIAIALVEHQPEAEIRRRAQGSRPGGDGPEAA